MRRHCYGADIKAERNDTRYARRNWPTKVFYSNALLSGNVNFDALPSLSARSDKHIDTLNEMQQKQILRVKLPQNSDTDIKLQQLHELQNAVTPHTATAI